MGKSHEKAGSFADLVQSCNLQFQHIVENGKRTAIHAHNCVEGQYLYDGTEKIIYIDESVNAFREITVSAGDLVLIPKNFYHSTSTQGKLRRLDFKLDLSSMISFSSASPLVLNAPVIREIFERMASYDTDEQTYYDHGQFLLLSLLLLLPDYSPALSRRKETFSTVLPDTDAKRKTQIEDFLNAYSSIPNALETLANSLHLSVRQTQTVVQKTMGKTFKQLILEQKMITAKFLIQTTRTPLEQIGEYVGYGWYNSFHTAYVNYYGCTPATHREKQIKK